MSQLEIYPIDSAGRARLVDAYSCGARVQRARRLRGGLGATTRMLTIEHADGRRERAVLRVYLPGRDSLTPERAQREFRTVELAQAANVPSARPLFLDAAGAHLGRPAILLSYLVGRSMYRGQDAAAWTEGLARAMQAIHAVSPERYDLSWLPRMGREEIASELQKMRAEVEAQEDGLALEALTAATSCIDRVVWPQTCLVHEDFWPGNTVWFRGKLAGVIDWANAKLGDPRLDLSQCRIDVLLVNGMEVADALEAAYGRLGQQPVHDLWFTDLFLGLKALLEYKIWLIGYHDAGLTFVTEELAGERIHAFLRRALGRCATWAS